MLGAVSETVGRFESIQSPRDAPVMPIGQMVELQCIDGAFFPSERRFTNYGSSRRNMDGAGVQRITIVKMRSEVQRALHTMNYTNDIPRNRKRCSDLTVSRLTRFDS